MKTPSFDASRPRKDARKIFAASFFAAVIFALFTQGGLLLRSTIGIDSEVMLYDPDQYYTPWMKVGRQGLVWMSRIMNAGQFSPLRSGVIAFFLLCVSAALWSGMFSYFSKEKNRTWEQLVFSALLVSSPLMTEQFYFKLQAQEVALSMCLCGAAVFLAWRFAAESKPVVYALFAVVICGFIISVYQSFVMLYVTGACAMFLLRLMRDAEEQAEADAKEYGRIIVRLVLVFAGGYLFYLLTTVLCGGSANGSGSVNWGTQSIGFCIMQIIRQVYMVVRAHQPYYTIAFAPLALIAFVLFFVRLRKGTPGDRGKGRLAFFLTAYLCLLASPFLVNVFTGNMSPPRVLFPVAFVIAFLSAWIVRVLRLTLFEEAESAEKAAGRKRETTAVLIIGVFCILFALADQVMTSRAFCRTDALRYEQDKVFAALLWEKIAPLQNAQAPMPVCFFGRHEAPLSPESVRGDLIGASFFAWDDTVEPVGYLNSGRIMMFCDTLGIRFPRPSAETAHALRETAGFMKAFPEEGSVRVIDGVIVVKLSNF